MIFSFVWSSIFFFFRRQTCSSLLNLRSFTRWSIWIMCLFMWMTVKIIARVSFDGHSPQESACSITEQRKCLQYNRTMIVENNVETYSSISLFHRKNFFFFARLPSQKLVACSYLTSELDVLPARIKIILSDQLFIIILVSYCVTN